MTQYQFNAQVSKVNFLQVAPGTHLAIKLDGKNSYVIRSLTARAGFIAR